MSVFPLIVRVHRNFAAHSWFSGYEYFCSGGNDLAEERPSACHSCVCMACFMGHELLKMWQQKLHSCLPGWTFQLHMLSVYGQGPNLFTWCGERARRKEHINKDRDVIMEVWRNWMRVLAGCCLKYALSFLKSKRQTHLLDSLEN